MKTYTKEQIEKAFQEWHENFKNEPEDFMEVELGRNDAKEQAEYLVSLMGENNMPEKVMDKFTQNGIDPEISIEYWSYPHTFRSTSGPHGGIGGQAMTTFQVEAYVSPLGVVYVSDGVIKFSNKSFTLSWPF